MKKQVKLVLNSIYERKARIYTIPMAILFYIQGFHSFYPIGGWNFFLYLVIFSIIFMVVNYINLFIWRSAIFNLVFWMFFLFLFIPAPIAVMTVFYQQQLLNPTIGALLFLGFSFPLWVDFFLRNKINLQDYLDNGLTYGYLHYDGKYEVACHFSWPGGSSNYYMNVFQNYPIPFILHQVMSKIILLGCLIIMPIAGISTRTGHVIDGANEKAIFYTSLMFLGIYMVSFHTHVLNFFTVLRLSKALKRGELELPENDSV